MRLRNRTAIVTGAAQGFGYGIAETFIREGAVVAILDLNGDAAARAAQALGPAAIAFQCNVADSAEVSRVVSEAISGLGHLDILVNNAGTTHRNQPMLDVDEAEYDRVFAVNVKSIYLLAKVVVPHFRTRGHGVILNIGSTAGIRPRPGLAWYNASKGAVNLVSKSMAIELAPDKIRVNAIAPVAGETPLLASFMGEDTPEKRAAFKASVPWGRLSTPAGHRQLGAVPVLGRGRDGDRRGADRRRRPLHLAQAHDDLPAALLSGIREQLQARADAHPVRAAFRAGLDRFRQRGDLDRGMAPHRQPDGRDPGAGGGRGRAHPDRPDPAAPRRALRAVRGRERRRALRGAALAVLGQPEAQRLHGRLPLPPARSRPRPTRRCSPS